MKIFVQMSTIFVLFNKTAIGTKFLTSPVIFTVHKRQTTFWKSPDEENFVVVVSRIIHVEVG